MAKPTTESANAHETALIRTFVVREKRDRLLSFLRNPKTRGKLRAALPHFNGLDDRYTHLIPPAEQNPSSIEELLRKKGAPDMCHLVSESPDLDGRDMPLTEALVAVIGSSMGTFVLCVPGRLAYFEFEDIGQRYLLERKTN